MVLTFKMVDGWFRILSIFIGSTNEKCFIWIQYNIAHHRGKAELFVCDIYYPTIFMNFANWQMFWFLFLYLHIVTLGLLSSIYITRNYIELIRSLNYLSSHSALKFSYQSTDSMLLRHYLYSIKLNLWK